MTFFGNKVSVDEIQLRWSDTGLACGPNPMTGVFIRKNLGAETGAERGWTYEDGSREWSYAATRQIMTRVAHNHQKLGKGKEKSSSRSFRDNMTMSTLLVQICKLKKCMRINVVAFSHLICSILYGRPRKLIQRVKTGRKETSTGRKETQTKCKVIWGM